MALKATIYKVDLDIADMDRHYYANHSLTLAQHPSETDERLMLRLLAFALNADPELNFTRGLSADDEPDLWKRDLTGEIELWIELGLPDERRLRKAVGRARRVLVYAYGGRTMDVWWEKSQRDMRRLDNVGIHAIGEEESLALAKMLQRTMRLSCTIQEGEVSISDGTEMANLTPTTLLHHQ